MPTTTGKRPADIIDQLRDRGVVSHLRSRAKAAHCTAEELVGVSRHAHIQRARAFLWCDMQALSISCATIGGIFGRTKGTVYRVIKRAQPEWTACDG